MVLLLFMGGVDPCLILPMELKNRGLMGIGKCKFKGPIYISQNQARWKHSKGIIAGILIKNFQKIII